MNARECELGNITRVCCSLLFYFWIKAKNIHKRPRTLKSHECVSLMSSLSYEILSITSAITIMTCKKEHHKIFIRCLPPINPPLLCGSVNYNKCWLFLRRVSKVFEKFFSNKTKDFTTHISHNKQNHDCFSHVMREKFPPHDLRLAVVRLIEKKEIFIANLEPKWETNE